MTETAIESPFPSMNDQIVALPIKPVDSTPVLVTRATAGSLLPQVAAIPGTIAPAASRPSTWSGKCLRGEW